LVDEGDGTMTDGTELSRRAALTLGGVGAVGSALALAGCAPADSGDATGSDPTVSETPASDAPASEAPADGAAGEQVATLADIPVGGSISATIGGEPALLAQPTAGQVVAFSAICTHQQCAVAAAGSKFECPCHGSIFDAATGEVETGPALEPLPSIAVTVDGDRVVAG